MIEYKGYYIKQNKQIPSHYEVVTVGRGGKIPDILSGFFTSLTIARASIDRYLEIKNKGKEDGKTLSKG
jgi:hypothetical protein